MLCVFSYYYRQQTQAVSGGTQAVYLLTCIQKLSCITFPTHTMNYTHAHLLSPPEKCAVKTNPLWASDWISYSIIISEWGLGARARVSNQADNLQVDFPHLHTDAYYSEVK